MALSRYAPDAPTYGIAPRPRGSDERTPDREARRVYALALDLVAAQGFDGVLRIQNHITIAITDNVLTITRDADGVTVMCVVAGDPPAVVKYLGGAWCRLLQRTEHRST